MSKTWDFNEEKLCSCGRTLTSAQEKIRGSCDACAKIPPEHYAEEELEQGDLFAEGRSK